MIHGFKVIDADAHMQERRERALSSLRSPYFGLEEAPQEDVREDA